MKHVCRLYRAVCRVIGPRHEGYRITFSAWLWRRELAGKGYLLRELVDDTFLVWRGDVDHCRTCFEHETKGAK